MPGSPMPSRSPAMNAHPAASASTPAPAAVVPAMSLADFEQIAMQRNPTLKQAMAQFEAAMNRSLQAGLYPNPVIGYAQDQIGSFTESRPTANGFAVKGKPSPGDNIGRVHPVADRDRGQAPPQPRQVRRGGQCGAMAGHRAGDARPQ